MHPISPVDAGVLDGDLYLRGLGDPSLSTRSYQKDVFDLTTTSFETFAKKIKQEGIRKITGRVARRRLLVRQAADRTVLEERAAA